MIQGRHLEIWKPVTVMNVTSSFRMGRICICLNASKVDSAALHEISKSQNRVFSDLLHLRIFSRGTHGLDDDDHLKDGNPCQLRTNTSMAGVIGSHHCCLSRLHSIPILPAALDARESRSPLI